METTSSYRIPRIPRIVLYDIDFARSIKEDHIFDPNIKDRFGASLIFYPSWQTADRIKLLIDKGINVNQQDNNGRTALMVTALSNIYNHVKMLLEAGANPLILDNKGKKALDYAIPGTKDFQLLLDYEQEYEPDYELK